MQKREAKRDGNQVSGQRRDGEEGKMCTLRRTRGGKAKRKECVSPANPKPQEVLFVA